MAGEEEVGEEEEEAEAAEGESGSPDYQKTLMEEEKRQNPLPGRNPHPSHWPGRRCPSHASRELIGGEQREKVVVDKAVTEGMGGHVEGYSDDADDEGRSSSKEH